MGKDHDLPGDLYDDLPRALATGPDWLRDAWEGTPDGRLRSAVLKQAPIGFFSWVDPDSGWHTVPTDGSHDDGSHLVSAPYSDFDCPLFDAYHGVGDLDRAQAHADALLAAARRAALDAELLRPVLHCADPGRAHPFALDAALRTAALAGLTPGTRPPELPTR
ncbi:hypothetical protein ACO0M4_13220 [Streptomyces sp. RGM 3693]|uniref:hypothetical protein n=1 Tax=Streptomyces sp. RGM 3693 TaxID=3413284 RepID=UPI003D29DEC9